jgi:hypothetical protein
MYAQPYLQKYKGKDTRHNCPACKAKLSFTQYLDGNTHRPIHYTVGKCNRESKCGYHYTPKQYFMDNPSLVETRHTSSNYSLSLVAKQPTPTQPPGTIPFSFVERSASYKSNFVRFLCEFMSVEQIKQTGESYALGATKNKEVIFWQIDINGKVRTGKIMQYNPLTGKRLKHESGAIDWVHNKLKKSGKLPDDFNLQQSFFGEHLLTIYPNKSLAIVESEKSAIIASCVFPDLVWLAAGNLNGLSIEKCQVLKGRDVILYPDLGAFEKWSEKAREIKRQCSCTITVSNVLENNTTPEAKANGLDIVDLIIAQLCSQFQKSEPISQNPFSPTLQSYVNQNNLLTILIDRLELIEI